jgi:C-terminal processing protease CtpA/Prc
MLAATEDPHIWLTVANEVVPAFRRDVRSELNAAPKLLPQVIQNWKQPHPVVATGQAAPGVGYIAIHSWDRKHAPQALDAALAALGGFGGLPALIVDVRLNGGGDERLAREFAGCFVRNRAKYAQHVTVDPASGGFSPPIERWIEPTAGGPAYSGRVAVLMGRANMSSAEAFLLMMKQAPNVTLIGDRSYGASGNPQPHVLANGVTVYLPSWQAMLPDGTPLERKGIAPTIEVKTTLKDFARRDPVLEKAIEVLRP